MKKIIVISDTHGNSKAIDKIFSEYQFDYLFFLGDTISDLGVYSNDERVRLVRGNCDFFSSEKHETFVKIEDVLIFYTHGHDYGVKYTLRRLYDRVAETGVQLVLYGHTHKFTETKMGDIIFLNSGALSNVRGGNKTFAIVTIDGVKITIEKHSF